MDEVRLGSVGLGWWGGMLANSAVATGSARIVACFARRPEARDSFAAEHGCRAMNSLDDLLSDDEVEGVLVATPHSTHADLVVQIASAGKHVFVEKPLTLTVADAKRCIEAAAAAGVVLQVGHNRRRQPANRRIQKLISSGELGTVVQLEGNQSGPNGLDPNFPEWRRDPVECPAGGMTALGVHIVDTFNSFVGPAARVAAFSKQVHGWHTLDESTTVVLEYESGPLGYIGTTYFAPPVNTLVVYATEGNAWNQQDGTRFFLQRRGEPARSELEIDTLDTIVDEMAEFARCIREGDQPETGPEQGLEVAAVLEGISRSVETGRAVDLPDLR